VYHSGTAQWRAYWPHILQTQIMIQIICKGYEAWNTDRLTIKYVFEEKGEEPIVVLLRFFSTYECGA
jgi:hypothetical protein